MFKSCLASIRRGLAKYLRKIRTTDLSPKRDLFSGYGKQEPSKLGKSTCFFSKKLPLGIKKAKHRFN